MKICYIVYREENVLVYQSQVLEYLQLMKTQFAEIESVEIVLYRHQANMFKKQAVEEKALRFVDGIKSFASLPLFTKLQLKIDAWKAKKYVKRHFKKSKDIAVICRGELSTYIASYAFAKHPGAKILFDNRGLPIEESLLAHEDQLVHKINRRVKKWAVLQAKDRCDMYNFVTHTMREYCIKTYGYREDLPYTVIPTLYQHSDCDKLVLEKIAQQEGINKDCLVVNYIGSTAAWQSMKQFVHIVKEIGERYQNAKFVFLIKGDTHLLETLPQSIKDRITIKTVPHDMVKYYLALSDIGIIIRDDNIVNAVAAPTKVAEYLTNGVSLLYSGTIGIIEDLINIKCSIPMIRIDEDSQWLNKLSADMDFADTENIKKYFDMASRQFETVEMLRRSFE